MEHVDLDVAGPPRRRHARTPIAHRGVGRHLTGHACSHQTTGRARYLVNPKALQSSGPESCQLEQTDLSSDAIVISHYHPDHFSDFLVMRYAPIILSQLRDEPSVKLALPRWTWTGFCRRSSGRPQAFVRYHPRRRWNSLTAGDCDSGPIMDFRDEPCRLSWSDHVRRQALDGVRAPRTSDTGPCNHWKDGGCAF